MPLRDPDKRREYLRKYQLDKYHTRREQAVSDLGGTCTVCGTTEELEIDHIDPGQKSFSIGTMWSVSYDRFMAELSKCQLLCRDDHVKKTRAERRPRWNHGTIYGYTRMHCECDACSNANSEWNRRRREQRRK